MSCVFRANLISQMYDHLDIDLTDIRLIVIVGVPGSGKTTLTQTLAKRTGCVVHDDFITQLYNGQLYRDLMSDQLVCINDPRLCQRQILNRYISNIERHIKRSQILFILIDIDPTLAIEQIAKRADQKAIQPQTVYNYAEWFDLNHYIKWHRYIITYTPDFPAKIFEYFPDITSEKAIINCC